MGLQSNHGKNGVAWLPILLLYIPAALWRIMQNGHWCRITNSLWLPATHLLPVLTVQSDKMLWESFGPRDPKPVWLLLSWLCHSPLLGSSMNISFLLEARWAAMPASVEYKHYKFHQKRVCITERLNVCLHDFHGTIGHSKLCLMKVTIHIHWASLRSLWSSYIVCDYAFYLPWIREIYQKWLLSYGKQWERGSVVVSGWMKRQGNVL